MWYNYHMRKELKLGVLFAVVAARGMAALTVGVTDQHLDVDHNVVENCYVESLVAAGHIPVVVPCQTNEAALAAIVAKLDVLIFTGGADVDPSRYKTPRSPQCGKSDLLRDEFELRLLAAARARRLPVMGVCRGCQLVNVGFGGTLWQDLPSEFPKETDGVSHGAGEYLHPEKYPAAHTVKVLPGTRLAEVLGAGELSVNSHHHQAVKNIAPGFRVTAVAPDGVIEGIESTNYPAFCVQFHPEALVARAKENAAYDHQRLTKFFTALDALCNLRGEAAAAGKESPAFEAIPELRVPQVKVQVGLAKPVRVLHVSDAHLTRVDLRDPATLRDYALSRSRMGRELGEYYLDMATAWCRREGVTMIHTGDLVAYCGAACLENAGRRLKTDDIIACVGNHEFWLSGDRKDVVKNHEECLPRLQAVYGDGLTASVREIGGINFFVFDNASQLVSKEVADAFDRVILQGKPIVLVCHVPLATADITWYACGNRADVCDDVTWNFVEKARREPLVKAVLAGHVHVSRESRFSPTAVEYVSNALFNGEARAIVFE